MKTLYISDLDGTLFNREKEVSDFSRQVINRFIEEGGLFTVATARTAYSCIGKLQRIKIQVPLILMNGVFFYDMARQRYAEAQSMDPDKIWEVEKVLERHHNQGFLYLYEENSISIYYKNTEDVKNSQYFRDWALDQCPAIQKTACFADAARGKDAVYFAWTGKEEELLSIWEDLKEMEGVSSSYYQNIYNGMFCLEAFDAKASKASALQRLKDRLGADQVIVFGDNMNDISMIQAADESYATDNAVEEVKRIVHGVLDSCDDDGVAKFLKKKYGIQTS